jgi:hypothetical protein
MLHTWSSEHRRSQGQGQFASSGRIVARRGVLTPNYRAESYGPFKLPIENQLCQEWRRRFLSLHFLFKDLTQY